MDVILAKLSTIWPELTMLIGATVCLITGLAPAPATRKLTAPIAGVTLLVALIVTQITPVGESPVGFGLAAHYIKIATCLVGLVLLMLAAGVPDALRQVRSAEASASFEPGNDPRGEFFAFFLFSLTGVMLTAGASDLVWLFLALELTSLPTYVMVSIGRDNLKAQESGVKYFFLGALSAAIFLYGFALIYGATGYTEIAEIRETTQVLIANNGGELPPLLLMGYLLAILGICFKIAAFPMHFYTADVYQGASTPVSAFLAFVPKTAGFAALITIVGAIGWNFGADGHHLPATISALLWAVAAITMTLGNVLGLLQTNVKRILAYSSIAQSGYMLVGLLAGAEFAAEGMAVGNGIAAVLFYLVAYAFGTIAAFAVLGCLQSRGDEAETLDDLAGLHKRCPGLAIVMALSMLSLIGLPPMVGFIGKLYLIGAAFYSGYAILVIVLVLNSAVSAAYYLRIASVCYFGEARDDVKPLALPARRTGGMVAALLALILGIPAGIGSWMVTYARDAATFEAPKATLTGPADANAEAGDTAPSTEG